MKQDNHKQYKTIIRLINFLTKYRIKMQKLISLNKYNDYYFDQFKN